MVKSKRLKYLLNTGELISHTRNFSRMNMHF
ncbi:hypothetical protein GECvBN5_gp165c [Salmonella phage GEC_vB_N5]|uniref:Uncharacterized protein n=1 Tax=Salmonella phage GEC_vB_N5 TaxID=2777378 RepID=A0A7S9SRZ4_9CAUD|nr:hypothetical protein GECvBN5_gp165c [Salmonella phage GEC_vB_N5]